MYNVLFQKKKKNPACLIYTINLKMKAFFHFFNNAHIGKCCILNINHIFFSNKVVHQMLKHTHYHIQFCHRCHRHHIQRKV